MLVEARRGLGHSARRMTTGKKGRPTLYKEPRVQMHFRVDRTVRDAIDKVARKKGQTVQEYLRRLIVTDLVAEGAIKKVDWD